VLVCTEQKREQHPFCQESGGGLRKHEVGWGQYYGFLSLL